MLGDFVISDLGRHGVGVEHIRRMFQTIHLRYGIFTVKGEDRRYLHAIGANAEFSLDDLDFELLDQVRVLYVGGYLAMPAFTRDQLTLLLREAKRRGAVTVLDVVMPAGVVFGLEHVAGALPWTDYFLPNEDEAQRLTGRPGARAQAEGLSASNEDCVVVITRGQGGSVAKHREQFIETEPFPMEAIDESGAGDAFAAGVIIGVLENWALEHTLSFAAAVGASCTRALGCSAGIFTFDEAGALVERRSARGFRDGTIMPLHSLQEILSDARREAYGVPYCESWNLESAQAVVAAAERVGSPAIVGFNGGFLQHRSRQYPEKLAWYAGVRLALETTRVPVALLLNESTSVEQIEEAIQLGFNAVMPDNGGLPSDEYRKLVKRVVAVAHRSGVWVEAQIGTLPAG